MPVIPPGAGVAELADALDLGSSDENRGGSSPPARTIGIVSLHAAAERWPFRRQPKPALGAIIDAVTRAKE